MARIKASANAGKQDLNSAESAIRQRVLEGRLVPGQRLVEIDLMNELSVSRGGIREIFRRLESDGIITIEKNRGASVRKITRKEVDDAFEVLSVITLLAVEKVADRAKHEPEVRKELEASLEIARKFESELDKHVQIQDYLFENTRFWGCIGALSGNTAIEETRSRLQLPLIRLQVQGLAINSHQEEWLTMHQEILSALIEGNTTQAKKFVKKAQRHVIKEMLSLPDSAYA